MIRPWAMLGAPLDSSGARRGEAHAPAALRAAGLPAALGAQDRGDLDVAIATPERDPTTGIIGVEDWRAASATIADAVEAELAGGARPLVVGGDCTLLLGALAGARRVAGPPAMVFVDGHADCYDGQTSPTGEGADMELRIACGEGPAGLADLDGRRPLIAPDRVAVLGHRPPELSADVAEELAQVPAGVRLTSAPVLETGDAAAIVIAEMAAITAATERGGGTEEGGVPLWLHLDLDVLDALALPAVSYPQAQGLTWETLGDLLEPVFAAPNLIGMSVADLNADRDEGGAGARRVVELLAGAT